MVRYYIDTVPTEAADNLLKVQSTQPQSDDWISWVPLREVITLMGIRAEWARSLKSRFETLRIGQSIENYSPKKTAVADGIDEAHAFILADGGDAIKELQVGYFYPVESRSGAEISDDFQKFLPNVTSLSIDQDFAIWLERFGRQIDKLFLCTQNDDDIRAIEKNSTKLCSLRIIGYDDNLMNELICNGSANTLQSLDISTPLSGGQIENLQNNFRKLKRISITGDINAVTELLVSYGSQLEWATLNTLAGGFKEAGLRKITSACENARFRWNANYEQKYIMFERLTKL